MRRRRWARKRHKKRNRKQVTDFKEVVCCPSAVVQGEAQQKNEEECPGYLGSSGRPTAISTQPKRDQGRHHHVEAAVDWPQPVIFIYQWFEMNGRFQPRLLLIRFAVCTWKAASYRASIPRKRKVDNNNIKI